MTHKIRETYEGETNLHSVDLSSVKVKDADQVTLQTSICFQYKYKHITYTDISDNTVLQGTFVPVLS
jgi:hypothetical protein